MLSETKLNSSFPSIQFLVNGFSVPDRLDQNSKGGGILFYVRDKIIILPLIKSLFYHWTDTLFHRILRFYFLNKSKAAKMARMLFLQSPQKLNQRTFTGIYRRYSVL